MTEGGVSVLKEPTLQGRGVALALCKVSTGLSQTASPSLVSSSLSSPGPSFTISQPHLCH